MEYKNFTQLPKGVQKRIIDLVGDDCNNWVKEKIPALNNKTVLEAMSEDDGYSQVTQYLLKVEGYLGK